MPTILKPVKKLKVRFIFSFITKFWNKNKQSQIEAHLDEHKSKLQKQLIENYKKKYTKELFQDEHEVKHLLNEYPESLAYLNIKFRNYDRSGLFNIN